MRSLRQCRKRSPVHRARSLTTPPNANNKTADLLFKFNKCNARDPYSVLFLRVPKSASTMFLTLAERVRSRKGFKSSAFPDFGDAVMGPNDKPYDPRDDLATPSRTLERERFYRGVTTKIGLHAGKRIYDRGRTLRMLWYGHVFLPDFSEARHFQGKTSKQKKPSVVTWVKDPILRIASGYNYVRIGARSAEDRSQLLKCEFVSTTSCFFVSPC